MNETLTTQEYAALQGVSQRTVQRWIQQGLIFAVRVGREFQIPYDEQPPSFYQQQDLAASEVTAPPAIQQPEAAGFPTEGNIDDLEPEEVDEEEAEEEEEKERDCRDPDEFERKDLRKAFATRAEADAYAGDIPVGTEVFKRCSDGFFQVAVTY